MRGDVGIHDMDESVDAAPCLRTYVRTYARTYISSIMDDYMHTYVRVRTYVFTKVHTYVSKCVRRRFGEHVSSMRGGKALQKGSSYVRASPTPKTMRQLKHATQPFNNTQTNWLAVHISGQSKQVRM